MKSRAAGFRVCGWLLLMISLVVAARADGPQWVEVRSPHFSVATDAGEKTGREVAMRFEQMRAVFSELMTKDNVNIPVPLEIVAFRNTRELRQVAPLWNGKPTQLAGLFQSGDDRSFIMLDMSVENPWTVVVHEYAHQLMNGIMSRSFDPWFEEGFAEFFSTIEVDNKEAHVGKPSRQAYVELQRAGMMRVVDLFKVAPSSPTYNESGERRGVFYAESNLLMHYIFDNQLMPNVSVYFDLLYNKKLPVEDAIQQAFAMSPAHFDKVLREYVASQEYRSYSIPTHPDIVTSSYTVSPLSAADSSAILADIHLHSHDYHDKAIQEFEDILKVDANNAAACRGLGFAFLRKRQFSEAEDYFRRAVQLNSQDPRVHYYLALLINNKAGFSDRSRLPEMIQELETAITLDPNFADPYSLLGLAQGHSGDMAHGIANLQKAVTLSPRNESYQFNLAQLYVMDRKPDQAITILQTLAQFPEANVAMRANQALENAESLRRRVERDAMERVFARPTTADNDPDEPEDEEPVSTAAPGKVNAVKFMRGMLTSVDCSAARSAILTVVSGGTTWKINVPDTNHVVVLGADSFSCSWSKRNVVVNYVEVGAGEGKAISIELQ